MYTDLVVVIQKVIIIQDVQKVVEIHMKVKEFLNLLLTHSVFSTGSNRSRNDHSDGNHGGSGGGYNRSRNDYQSTSSGGNDSGIETQRDTIFIQNLPRNVTPTDLKDAFSQIGVIKVRFWIEFFIRFVFI
jgi:RNA recognition motif-containing protein